MNLTDIAFRRLHTQRLSGGSFESPEAVVRWFGAVQSQECEWSQWAIGLRLPAGTMANIVEHSIHSGSLVRSWPMRGTVHLVLAEDIRWMLELIAYRQNEKFLPFLAKLDLTLDVLTACRPVLERELAGVRLTRKQLYEKLATAGLLKNPAWGTHIIGYWSQAGLICPGPLQGKQPTVVLLDDWVPRAKALTPSRDEALSILAQRYFTSHGPATLQDFTWWSSLSAHEAATALDSIKPSLTSMDYEGKTYWLSEQTASLNLIPTPAAHLLPPYDEYTVAYKNRDAAIAPNRLKSARYGIFTPNVLINGQIVGGWKRVIKGTQLVLTIESSMLDKAQKSQIVSQAERFAAFYQLSLTLNWA